MSVISDQAISPGDLKRDIDTLKRQVKALTTARRLEAASVGRGGLRIQGGRLLAEDLDGDRVFEVTTDPADIFMRQDILAPFALAVLGQAIHSASAEDNVTSPSTDGQFVALDGGPEVAGVPIGESGRALVIVSADILAAPTGENGRVECRMGYAISGATDVEAATSTSLKVTFTRGDGDTALHPGSSVAASKVSLASGLSPGTHTFSSRYRVAEFNGIDEGEFFGRNITVVPF